MAVCFMQTWSHLIACLCFCDIKNLEEDVNSFPVLIFLEVGRRKRERGERVRVWDSNDCA